ncbi:MAG: bifunctional diaminohydroxyphosphoribosylaminopyrimidine deaminase/5-amino-6-(5-phosphoribosylamino)uracil reductase RibD [Maribacter sp.]
MSIKTTDVEILAHLNFDSLSTDEKYMLRCIEIAKNGLGQTAPNPMVGCVIVHNEKIIGEGFTSAYGGPHAEVNAIASVEDTSLLNCATLYVTLEPCSHFGKTPPCADLIIHHQIPKVVIGLIDPHGKVAGKGITKLKEAGCEVTTGVLEKACAAHHKRFLTYINQKRPYLLLKWAETADGYLAPDKKQRGNDKKPYWITNTTSRQLVHKWRSEEQGILVGTNTVLEDNPQLNVRDWSGKAPTRIVLDRTLKISGDYHVLHGRQPTFIFTEITNEDQYKKGLMYRGIDFTKNVPQQICDVLYAEQLQSLIIEGGSKTLSNFIEAGLWDEARIFRGTTRFNSGIKAPTLQGSIVKQENIQGDLLTILKND